MAVQQADGMNYAPKGKPSPVVKPGGFVIAAAALDHGHIYGMCNGLTEAGATLKYVYDPDGVACGWPAWADPAAADEAGTSECSI